MGNTMKRPAGAGRDDDRSYSEGGQPSTLFPSTLALPLEEAMRLVLNVIGLIFGGLWLAPAHRHHPVWIRSVAHRILCAVAVRANDHRQARRRYRRADREHHLAAVVRDLACDRAPGECGGDGADDHRYSAGGGQPQID